MSVNNYFLHLCSSVSLYERIDESEIDGQEADNVLQQPEIPVHSCTQLHLQQNVSYITSVDYENTNTKSQAEYVHYSKKY